MSEPAGGFCTDCGHVVESFEGLNGCPAFGSRGVPCAHRDQVTVNVNWHELHLLAVWAEHYGRSIGNKRTVFSIAARLEAQHASRGALTLAGELKELRAAYPGTTTTDGDLNEDIQRLEADQDPPSTRD